jgi:hypothetical protein
LRIFLISTQSETAEVSRLDVIAFLVTAKDECYIFGLTQFAVVGLIGDFKRWRTAGAGRALRNSPYRLAGSKSSGAVPYLLGRALLICVVQIQRIVVNGSSAHTVSSIA